MTKIWLTPWSKSTPKVCSQILGAAVGPPSAKIRPRIPGQGCKCTSYKVANFPETLDHIPKEYKKENEEYEEEDEHIINVTFDSAVIYFWEFVYWFHHHKVYKRMLLLFIIRDKSLSLRDL